MTNQEKADYHKAKANVFNKLYESYKELRDIASGEERVFWAEQADEMYNLFLSNDIEANKYLAVIKNASQHNAIVNDIENIFQ